MSMADAFNKASKKNPELKKIVKIAEGRAEALKRWEKQDKKAGRK